MTQTTPVCSHSDCEPEPFARKQRCKHYQRLHILLLTDGCKLDIKMVTLTVYIGFGHCFFV